MIHYTYFIYCHSFERISNKSQRGKWYISYLTVSFLQFHIFQPMVCWAVNKNSLCFKHMFKYYSTLAIMHLKKKKKKGVSCPVVSYSLSITDRRPPWSSVHGILQARIPEWVAISLSRRSSWPKDQTQGSHIMGRFLTVWATKSHYLGLPNLIYHFYHLHIISHQQFKVIQKSIKLVLKTFQWIHLKQKHRIWHQPEYRYNRILILKFKWPSIR